MKEYKVIQKMNNLLHQEDTKHLEKRFESSESLTLSNAIEYFTSELDFLSYPSKSYCVAIIYAHLIAFYFGESFWELLNDRDLLNGNDDFFVPYAESKEIYDGILKSLNFDEKSFRLDLSFGQLKATFDYFTEEFNVDPEKYLTSLLPSAAR